MSAPPVSGPLAGIRVVELAVVIAGPAASATLADWGASVVKIEPLGGDPQRRNTERCYFDLDNRGKRSVGLNLKSEEGRRIALDLADAADVFISNLRPDALERLGLDPRTLMARNDRLVYGLITGYGTTGPASGKAGYDIGAFWSRAGVAAALAGGGNEPAVSRPGMGDHTTGLALTAGIAAALFQRERTGSGTLVSTSLYRAGTYVISSDLTARLNGSHPRTGLRRAMYNPLLACYRSSDDRWFWLLGLEPERHLPAVLLAVGRVDLLADERFASFQGILRHSDTLMAILDVEFATRTLDEWVPIFAEHDVWWDAVQDLDEVLADPQLDASGAILEDGRGMRMIGPPVDFSTQPAAVVTAAPEAGQHTEDVLLELGVGQAGIARLRERGVIA